MINRNKAPRDIRIFALIGYQWPPAWFPNDWYTMHPLEVDAEGIPHTNRWQSDIIGYETPQARAQYAEFFSNVCAPQEFEGDRRVDSRQRVRLSRPVDRFVGRLRSEL